MDRVGLSAWLSPPSTTTHTYAIKAEIGAVDARACLLLERGRSRVNHKSGAEILQSIKSLRVRDDRRQEWKARVRDPGAWRWDAKVSAGESGGDVQTVKQEKVRSKNIQTASTLLSRKYETSR